MADPPPSPFTIQREDSRMSFSSYQPSIARRDSISSNASFYSDVEMAQEEVFAGPTSESLPTSAASFHHRRRPRADSEAAWSFYESEDQNAEPSLEDEEAVSFDEDIDVGYGDDRSRSDSLSLRRTSSIFTRQSAVDEPLLRPRLSTGSERPRQPRVSQKFYITSEDMTIVITGFNSSRIRFALYLALCISTLGLAWLLFRWFPRWRVRLLGKQGPLKDCDWVVIENQWGEFSIQDVEHRDYSHPLSSIFGSFATIKGRSYEYEDDDPVVEEFRYLDYRYIRLSYHPLLDKFTINYHWKDPNWDTIDSLRSGLDSDVKTNRHAVYGANVIDIHEKTVRQLLVDEAFHPFYVFQIASLILWSMDEYYYYAACIFVISAFSIATTLIDTRSTMRRLREVSRFVCEVRVLRNGFWRHVSSADLVPGDVYELTDPALTLLPCDSILLTGDCIVNESMLTGESVPVSKSPITMEALHMLDTSGTSIHPAVTRHFLYCGTKIIRARRPFESSDDVGLALVVKTGFNTTKGSLVRSMLFPKPSGFKFYRDSFYYIAVMGVIAFFGFIASLINFIRLGLAWHLIIIRALDLITIVVPPALPATLSIGTSFALSRLKKRDIFCISPQRVNVSGKIDVMCFDKTGTLTEDGLDVLGVHCVEKPSEEERKFTELLESAHTLGNAAASATDLSKSSINSMFHTMATCHSLRLVDGELLGDPLDLKMFHFTEWEFEEGGQANDSNSGGDNIDSGPGNGISPSVARPLGQPDMELGVLKSFEFDSHLRRTSVIVKRYKAAVGDVFVKGAPECMKDICVPESFPADFDAMLQHYTHNGYRVIACATKHITGLSWIKAQRMKRKQAESDLQFCGFIIFENKLKPATTGIIDELGRANIRRVMCTGDNILTAISVARNCHLIDEGPVFVPHFHDGVFGDESGKLRWQTVDDHEQNYVLDDYTLLPRPVDLENGTTFTGQLKMDDFCMAVTGEVFRWVVDNASEDYIHRMLVRGQVFARMSPDEKHELVEKLQSIDYTVGFCGDGANDCGALKAADVGISLSEAEASVAAPFTSRVFDITCVPQLIKEGRAALVTSFSCFKYMSIYSAIQFTSVSILYRYGSNLGDFQFLFIDLFLILPIAVFMGWSEPYPTLSRKRPTASLVSRKVLTPLLGQIFVATSLQLVCYELVKRQTWFIPPVIDEDKSNIYNSFNTTLFLYSCFQYIFAAVVLSVGPPFRQRMTQNYPFMIAITLGITFNCLMMFACPDWLYGLMQLSPMSTSFKLVLVVIAALHLILGTVGEQQILPVVAKAVGKLQRIIISRSEKMKKKYKVIDETMKVQSV